MNVKWNDPNANSLQQPNKWPFCDLAPSPWKEYSIRSARPDIDKLGTLLHVWPKTESAASVQVLKIHMSVLLTSLLWGQALLSQSLGSYSLPGSELEGGRSDPLLRLSSSPLLPGLAGCGWLLPQFFALHPSHLGCPPYSVNYNLITASLQIRSSPWSIIVWKLHFHFKTQIRGAHTSAVHACLSLFMCKNWETSLFPSPGVVSGVGGSDDCYQHCPAPRFTTTNLHLCLYKYLSCCFECIHWESHRHVLKMKWPKHLFAMFFIDAHKKMFQELILGAMWNVQLRGSIMDSHMSLFFVGFCSVWRNSLWNFCIPKHDEVLMCRSLLNHLKAYFLILPWISQLCPSAAVTFLAIPLNL